MRLAGDVDEDPEFYTAETWRGRSADKKQGSEGVSDTKINPDYIYKLSLHVYKNLLNDGVAPEQARMVLPQAMMTEWYWSEASMPLQACVIYVVRMIPRQKQGLLPTKLIMRWKAYFQ